MKLCYEVSRISLIISIVLLNFTFLVFEVKTVPSRKSFFIYTKDEGNPILSNGPPDSWDEKAIIDHNVFKESANLYKMYYLIRDNSYNQSTYSKIYNFKSANGVFNNIARKLFNNVLLAS